MADDAVTRFDDPTHPDSRRAFHSPKAWARLFIVLLIGMGIDLGSKSWTFANVTDAPVILDRQQLLANRHFNPIPRHDSVTVLPFGLLDFQLVINRGAVFGIGEDNRIFFIAFTILALGAGAFVFSRYTQQRHRIAHIALGLILAGGLGNLYDRMAYGVVRDFLHMLPGWNLPFGWRWPAGGSSNVFPWVFNVADVMLLVGIGLFMIHINRVEKQRHEEERAGQEQAAADGHAPDSATAPATEAATAAPASADRPAAAHASDS
jgi:signal peptidase II